MEDGKKQEKNMSQTSWRMAFRDWELVCVRLKELVRCFGMAGERAECGLVLGGRREEEKDTTENLVNRFGVAEKRS